jgi:hypothetical protein
MRELKRAFALRPFQIIAVVACARVSTMLAPADAAAQGAGVNTAGTTAPAAPPAKPATSAPGKPAGSAPASGHGPGAAGASPGGSGSAAPTGSAGGMPPGHPRMPPPDDDDDSPHGAGGHGGGGGMPGMFRPPEDGALDDPTIPKGTIQIHISDLTGKPLPSTEVTMGILYNSVAKGESKKRVTATTDAMGVVQFQNLDVGTGVAYRPMVLTDGATFSMMPFQLSQKNGMRALLHVYPVVRELDAPDTLIASQAIIYAEVKDDRVQIQELLTIINIGKTAWVPNDVLIPLPANYTAFASQQGMTDVGVDAVPNKGVKLRGTFAPGQHQIEFKWQLPYSGEAEVHFDAGVAPHPFAGRVIAPASKDMVLDVPGFPPPESKSDNMGQRALITETRLQDKNRTTITVNIRGLPTEGIAKYVASLLALTGLGLGVVLAAKKQPARDRKSERARLLADLEDLERAHRDGDVGPKTYERARRELLDEIARTFATEHENGTERAETGRKKRRAA